MSRITETTRASVAQQRLDDPDASGGERHIADVQGERAARRLKIDAVGVKDIRHPVKFKDRSEASQSTIATISMSVGLPADQRGTHMSRFIQLLSDQHAGGDELSLASFRATVRDMAVRLHANDGDIELAFPYFVNKKAPVSGVMGLMDYAVRLRGNISSRAPTEQGRQSDDKRSKVTTNIGVTIPVTSLCPCSKEISDYGAHNQRSHVSVDVRSDGILWVEELIDMVEAQASAQLYSVLKRADEKYVTEHAYDNPKFVEDLVRDLAQQFLDDPRIDAFSVEVENFESIHNHSAFARIVHDKTASA